MPSSSTPSEQPPSAPVRVTPEPVTLPEPWSRAALTVVVPTYVEAENLPVLVRRLMSLDLPGLRVVVVDDNSPDGTGEVADKLALEFPGRVSVVHRKVKDGLGRAYVAGMTRALEDGAEYVAQMDADLSHPVGYIPQLLGTLLATNAGVVIGIAGVLGGVSVLASVFLAMLGSLPTRGDIMIALNVILASLIITVFLGWQLIRQLPRDRRAKRILLETATSRDAGYISAALRSELIGKEGVAVTDLRPAGTGQFEDEYIDVVSESGWVVAGTPKSLSIWPR
jgi:glycosyltransferase involved in cell wall biosynthesis